MASSVPAASDGMPAPIDMPAPPFLPSAPMAVMPLPLPLPFPLPPLHAAREAEERMQRLSYLSTRYEIRADFIARLRVLEDFDIVAVCDDSGSMDTGVAPLPGQATGPYAPRPTRWTELRHTMSIVVDLATTLSPAGVDCFFLNRPPVLAARSASDIQVAFDHAPPSGYTPLTRALKGILGGRPSAGGRADGGQRKLLLLIATDGQPTDDRGNVDIAAFIAALKAKAPHVYIQIMACTDDDNAIAYLEKVDTTVPRVDVCDDYLSERRAIQRVQGGAFLFSFGDYVVKALLGPVDTYFDGLDEPKNSCCLC